MTTALAILAVSIIECYDVATLIHEESRWNTRAVSSAGCCGLLQVHPRYLRGWLGRRWTCADLRHPFVGLAAGLHVRAYWRERAVRAGKPGCWEEGYTSGNEGFRQCLERP